MSCFISLKTLKAFYHYFFLVWKSWRPDRFVLSNMAVLSNSLSNVKGNSYRASRLCIYRQSIFNRMVCKRLRFLRNNCHKSLAKFHCLENTRNIIPWDIALCFYFKGTNLQRSYCVKLKSISSHFLNKFIFFWIL